MAAAASLGLAFILLLIPEAEPQLPSLAQPSPFAWKQDAFWASLEARFAAARSGSCATLERDLTARLDDFGRLLNTLEISRKPVDDPIYRGLETACFELAPLVAACPDHLPRFNDLIAKLRTAVKVQSRAWNLETGTARTQLYRLLYGSRAALEEVLLQCPSAAVPTLTVYPHDTNAAPASRFLGVTIQSGDVLVSRGGAPTSALIARGNDFPGNFSHIALVHVDDSTRRASVIEAHIDGGVSVSTLPDYFLDKKLRVMVLRLRPDLPQLKADPFLPHRAASRALAETRARRIPYDFAMDYRDHRALFCSEVAAAAYEPFQVRLWMNLSQISSPGVVSWLAAFGVRHFATQEPSDLEYDPQMDVVAEWRDPRTLLADHIDNAVTDAMLEGANAGEGLPYPKLSLPLARSARVYGWLLNRTGRAGPIPAGMSATAALRHKQFSQRHRDLQRRVTQLAAEFKQSRGYVPPYPILVTLAQRALND